MYWTKDAGNGAVQQKERGSPQRRFVDVVKEDMQRFDVTEEDVFVIKSPGQASWKVQKDTAFSLAHNSICPEIANTDTQSLTYTVVKTKDVHSLNSLYLPNSFLFLHCSFETINYTHIARFGTITSKQVYTDTRLHSPLFGKQNSIHRHNFPEVSAFL